MTEFLSDAQLAELARMYDQGVGVQRTIRVVANGDGMATLEHTVADGLGTDTIVLDEKGNTVQEDFKYK